MRVLLIEDDAATASYISKGLSEAGHHPEHADNGKDGLFLALEQDFDALIVDRMLPGLDGLSVVKSLRGAGKTMPVLLLTALADVPDRVEGLRAGADDYLTKPFAFAELLARLEVMQRRGEPTAPETHLKLLDLELDTVRHRVSRAGQVIDLQPREYRLLEYLLRHVGQVVTRTMLLENVWDYHFDPQTNVIDSHISRLRGKIDKGHEQALLHTVRGVGYKLDID